MDPEAPRALFTSPVLHYVAMLKAAADFGLGHDRIDEIARRFPVPEPSDELADALAAEILARSC